MPFARPPMLSVSRSSLRSSPTAASNPDRRWYILDPPGGAGMHETARETARAPRVMHAARSAYMLHVAAPPDSYEPAVFVREKCRFHSEKTRKLGFSSMRTILVWHRHDLRLDDNALYANIGESYLASIYVFDPAQFARRPSSVVTREWDVAHTGPHQARGLLEALAGLRDSLRARGVELYIRQGDPASLLPQMALNLNADEVRWHEEPGTEEVSTSQRVRSALLRARREVHIEHGVTLFHPDDLPRADEWAALAHPRQKMRSRKRPPAAHVVGAAPTAAAWWQQRLAGMPRIMGEWRRAVRARTTPRPTLPTAAQLLLHELKPPPSAAHEAPGELPSLEELMAPVIKGTGRRLFGLPDDAVRAVVADAIAASRPSVSEAAARSRLHAFVRGGVAARADRSLADPGADGSSQLSLPLALGCLSPRHVYEASRDADGAAWLASHIEMRDYFLFSAFAAGGALFASGGWHPVAAPVARWTAPTEAADAWVRWALGRTGLPLVDAAMRELIQTGCCSNRCRQNAASLLAKDLCIDWRAGAEWLQWCLSDHEVSANWGNWVRSSSFAHARSTFVLWPCLAVPPPPAAAPPAAAHSSAMAR